VATVEITGAEEVSWNLSDLYEGGDDPRLESDIAEAEALGIGRTAHGDQHHFAIERFGLAAFGRLKGEFEALALAVDADDLGAELEGEALLGQHALELLRHLAIEAGR